MKTYTEQDLREKAAASESMPDLLKALGYGRSTNTIKKLKREMAEYGIDYSHFNPIAHLERRRKYPLVTKECTGCGTAFKTRKGHKKEQKFCSNVCANRNMSPEAVERRKQSVIASVAKRKAKNGKGLAAKTVEVELAPAETPKVPYAKPTITRRLMFPQPQMSPSGRIKYTKELLEPLVKFCYTYSDILRILGRTQRGASITALKRHISNLGLSTEHFSQAKMDKIQRLNRAVAAKTKPDDAVFCQGGTVAPSSVRYRLAKRFPPVECKLCGLKEWLGKPIAFDMDHINGDNLDNRLENLRWLCPNCHRQTSTFGSKRGLPTMRRECKCPDCGTKMSGKSNRCRACNAKFLVAKRFPTPT